MARPTKLTKELLEKAQDYSLNWKMLDGAVIPTIEGLSLHCNLARSTVYAWCEIPTEFNVPANTTPEQLPKWQKECTKLRQLHAEFSDIVENILLKQSRTLISHGLDGAFNASITKLILSGKHGYVEKQATDLTTNGKDLPMPILGAASVHSDSGDSQAS